MTTEPLMKLVPHLPPGAEINISLRVGDSQTPSPPAGARPPDVSGADAKEVEPGWFKANTATKKTLGVSHEELRAAAKRSFVEHKTKTEGKDAGALLIEEASFKRYMERRERIKNLSEATPDGWPGPGGGS